jgi:hypothetical protein
MSPLPRFVMKAEAFPSSMVQVGLMFKDGELKKMMM